jgi:RHS repeat-associated protein
LTDSSGAVVNTYAYDPWGTLLVASETVANPYRYASYRYDTSTGLSYCWNRYYAPELARFLTRDIYPGELSDPVTMNPYLYCGGDPVNAVDPSGMATMGLNVTFQMAFLDFFAASKSQGVAWDAADLRHFGDLEASNDVKVAMLESTSHSVGPPRDAATQWPPTGGGAGLACGWSLQSQWTSADSVESLVGNADRYGLDWGFASVDLLVAESYWGWEIGVGYGAPGAHAYRERTRMLDRDVLRSLR